VCDRVDLYDIIDLFYDKKSIFSTLKIFLILNFIWFLLIIDYENQKKIFNC